MTNIGGWTANCNECGAALQVITEGREIFAAQLEALSTAAGTRIIGTLNEELGAWAVLADSDDVAICPVCKHASQLLRPPAGADLN